MRNWIECRPEVRSLLFYYQLSASSETFSLLPLYSFYRKGPFHSSGIVNTPCDVVSLLASLEGSFAFLSFFSSKILSETIIVRSIEDRAFWLED